MPASATLVHAAKVAAMRVLEAAPDAIGSVSSVHSHASAVIFTYDDGPTPVRTPAVLRALAEHDATATFFVLMTSVGTNPELLAEVIAAGHEIGLHGVDHRHLSALSPRTVEDNLRRGKAELEDAVGREVRWFRPPYGDQSPATWRAIRRAGMTSVIWSATSWDWNAGVDNDMRVRMATMSLRAGSIILLHDGHAGALELVDDGPEPQLDRYDLSSRLLTVCAQKGLVGRSLGDALEAGGRIVTRPHFNLRPRLPHI